MDKILFSNRLKAERKKKFRSQEAFAEEYDRKYNWNENTKEKTILATLKNYENPNKDIIPSLEIVDRMCGILGCDVDYLLGRIDYKTHDNKDIASKLSISEKSVEVLCKKPIVTDEDRETMPEDFIGWGFSIDRDALDKLFASQFFSEFMRSIKACVDVVANPPLEVQLVTYAESLIPGKQKEMREAAHSFARDIMQQGYKAQDRALIFEVQYIAAKIAEEIIQSARKKEGGNGI